MVQINFAQKQVNAKIVYYGPGMSGKTTNLEIIHQRAPDQNRGDLTSISTDGDRTLFFDFMPLDLGTVAGMRTCFQIYTVPGQVYYNSTRKLVLQGVDGVVFVADSSASMVEENLESLRNLEENLNEYGKSLSNIALVIQYNKRDLPDALPVDQLNQLLNHQNAPTFEAIARTGQGVFPTLKALAACVLETIHSGAGSKGLPVAGAAPAAALPGKSAEVAEPVYAKQTAQPVAMARAGAQRPTQQLEPIAMNAPAPAVAAQPQGMGMQGGAMAQPMQQAHAPQQQAAPGAGLHLAARGSPDLAKTNVRSRPQGGAPAPAARRTAPPKPAQAARPARATPSKLEGTRFRPRAARPEARPTPAKKGNAKVVAGVVIVVAVVVGIVLTNVAFSLF
jgi:mutual gliding-motility protein MglA